jgi:hypothetical protein
VVRVTDAVGAHESIPVTVGAGVSVTPTTTNATAGSKVSFNVAGGSGMSYVWSIADNQSGAKIDTSTGVYTAGSKGNVTDIVAVQDSLHNGASATVHVQPATPSGGPDGGTDGGSLDAGLDADLGEVVVPTPSSGCGCEVVGGDRSLGGGSRSSSLAALAGLIGLSVSLRVRQRRRDARRRIIGR